MEDLSLHLLDIMENSLNAQASRIEVRIEEDPESDLLTLEIADDGKGMDAETLQNAANPFFTTRTTRRYGLGLSMLSESAKATGGKMTVDSTPKKGTRVVATFRPSHIDMKPLGDVPQTLLTLIAGHPEIELCYHHTVAGNTFSFSTAETTGAIGSVQTLRRIEERLRKGLQRLRKPGGAS